MSAMSGARPGPDRDQDAWPVWQATLQRATGGKFADLVIECGDQKFNVHKLVMAASPFFSKACEGPFKEAQEGIIRLPDDDPEAVKALIEYLYHGRYGLNVLQNIPESDCVSERTLEESKGQSSAPIQVDSSSESDTSTDSDIDDESDNGETNDRNENKGSTASRSTVAKFTAISSKACSALPLDAKLYALGEKYDIQGLKKNALETFKRTIAAVPRAVTSEPFRLAAEVAFNSTPGDDEGLRRAISQAITDYEESSTSEEVALLLTEIPDLNLHVTWSLFSIADDLKDKIEHLHTQQKKEKELRIQQQKQRVDCVIPLEKLYFANYYMRKRRRT